MVPADAYRPTHRGTDWRLLPTQDSGTGLHKIVILTYAYCLHRSVSDFHIALCIVVLASTYCPRNSNTDWCVWPYAQVRQLDSNPRRPEFVRWHEVRSNSRAVLVVRGIYYLQLGVDERACFQVEGTEQEGRVKWGRIKSEERAIEKLLRSYGRSYD